MKNSYSKIYNPKTKKYININSQLGKYIAFRYLNKIGGGKISDGPCPENSNFYCPISQDIMKDPVICSDGHTYERAHIQKWFAQCEALAARLGHNPVYTSPLTMLPLANNILISNIALRNAIKEYNQWLKQKEEKEEKEEKEVNEDIKNTKDTIDHLNDESTLPSFDDDSSEEYNDPYDIFWNEITKIADQFEIPVPDEINSFSDIIEILERIWVIKNGFRSISQHLRREAYREWEYILLLMWDLEILQAIYYRILGRPSPSDPQLNYVSMLHRIYYSNNDHIARYPQPEEMLEYLIYRRN